jgi:hydroxymethylglutaryl-CoA lyase
MFKQLNKNGLNKYMSHINNLNYSTSIKIFEVGPRDGLQNEKTFVPTDKKISLIKNLLKSGLTNIELTSFVSPKAIPQFSDSDDVVKEVLAYTKEKNINANLSVLVPNEKGMLKAIQYGIKEVAIFTSVSEAFNKKNINCSIEESFLRFEPIMNLAKQHNIKVRGYVSCIAGCPYSGSVDNQIISDVTKRLLDIGAYEVSLGDTIGVGNPEQIKILLNTLQSNNIDFSKLAGHFHNTNGLALENIKMAISYGIKTFDSSVGGLGGCPYAVIKTDDNTKTKQRAIGNVSTESVIAMLKDNNITLSDNINTDMVNQISEEIKLIV